MTNTRIYINELPSRVVAINYKGVIIYNKKYRGLIDVFMDLTLFSGEIITIQDLNNIYTRKIS